MSDPRPQTGTRPPSLAKMAAADAWDGFERRRFRRGAESDAPADATPDRERGLAALAVNNPHLIVVLSLMIAILGSLSYLTLPADLLPAANLPAVQVVSFYSGMPVKEVEKNLTERLERYTGEAVGMERQESRSLVGVSVIKNYFGAGTDLNTAIAHTTASVMTALRKLPPGTMPPLILPFDPMASTPLALAAVSGDFSESHLFDVARHEVGNAIQAVPGAMAPTIMGGSERQITAYLDPLKLARYNLSPLGVLNRLTSFNTLIPSGDVLFGDDEVQIESNGSVDRVEEMNNFPLRSDTGIPVYLRDVGRAEDAKAIQTNVVMIDGKRQVYVPVFRQPGANSIQVVENVKTALAGLEREMKNYKFRVVMDQSSFIRHAISSISDEAWIGGAIAALMVLLFLGSYRATGAVLLSLPLSLLPAFLGLKALGATINAMTLGGLALSIGVLVDNSIVVIENIMTKLATGIPPRKASLDGASEVAMPVLTSTLVTLVVFLPVIFLTGIVRTLFLALSVSVVSAMAGSYLVAMTVIPLFTSRYLRGRAVRRASGMLDAIHGGIDRVTGAYGRLLERVLARRWSFVAGTTIALVLSCLFCRNLGTELFPRADAGNLVLQVRLKSGTRVDATVEFTKRLDKKLREWIDPSDLSMIVANAGVYYGFPAAFTTNSGSQDVFLNVELTEQRHRSSQYYAKILREKIPAAFPGTEVAVQLGGLLTSALNGGLASPIDIQIRGPKLGESHALAEALASRIRKIPGAVDVRVQQRTDSPKLILEIDRKKAGALGLSVDETLKNVVGALRSSVTFNPAIWVDPKNGVAYQFGIQFRERDVSTVEQLLKIPITGTKQDRSVPLGRIATIKRASGSTEINHVNLSPVVDVYLDAQDRDIGSLAKDISRTIESSHLPANYRADIRGEISEMKSAIRSLAGGFALAAIFVYLLLVVQFRSYSLPLIIMTAVPLALTGIAVALFVTNTYFSIQAAIGAIFMIGVAVAHGVLLIEFILHQAKAPHGADIDNAIVKASMARLRPITMTALASILALIPMAIGVGHGAEANIPLGRAVIGGQIVSTVLTLFLVPCLFRTIYRAGAEK